MKKLFLLCLAVAFCAAASAQKVYFLYLQSDDQSPFYARVGDKIHSSAAAGYLVIPNLTDSIYTFGLGFAKSRAAETKFSVKISQNDKGYIIKNIDDGLALFDMQDLSFVKADAAPKDDTVYETKTDMFSSILSKAADDPSILKVPVAKKEEPLTTKPADKDVVTVKSEETKPIDQPVGTAATKTENETGKMQTVEMDSIKTTVQKPEVAAVDSIVTQTVTKEISDAVVKQPVQSQEKKDVLEAQPVDYKPTVVSRYSESSTTEGFGIVYFDKKEDGIDTVRILIPASTVKLATESEVVASNESPIKVEQTAVAAENRKEATKSTETANTVDALAVSTASCKNIASDKDFLKLRKRMAAKENDDIMLDEARKEFRGRCYSVEQVRYLSSLFLTSASKYQFFDAAYNYVSDKNNFASLGSEIKDEHYSKRFRALIGE